MHAFRIRSKGLDADRAVGCRRSEMAGRASAAFSRAWRLASVALVAAASIGVLTLSAARVQEPALPLDREAFLKSVRDRLQQSHERFHLFAYKERRVDLHMNPFGRMGMGDTRVLQTYPSPNPRLTYRQEIARNGVPSSPEFLARQDADHRRKAAELTRHGARAVDERQARQRAQHLIDDVVSSLEFTVARRERRDGVPSVLVTFKGRPDARPATREGRIARVFAGSAWVDEATREVMYVEATATDDVSFGGFIARLYEGTVGIVKREEVAPGIWMPVSVTLRGKARALFRKATIEYVIEWFDYQRMGDAPAPGAGVTSYSRLMMPDFG